MKDFPPSEQENFDFFENSAGLYLNFSRESIVQTFSD